MNPRIVSLAVILTLAVPGAPRAETPAPAPAPAPSGWLDVDEVVREALAHNPDLTEASEKALAADARARASGRWPDLGVQAQLWQQPLSKPVDLSQANMLMLGLRQTFPAPGAASARQRAGEAEADAARASASGRRAELVFQVKRAFAQYWLAEQEQLIHLAHMEITDQIVQEARTYFAQGRISKADFLRTTVELGRVHAVLSDVAQQRRASGALLNSLMAREPDAPLGVPRSPALPEAEPDVSDMGALAGRKPEVTVAEDQVRRSEAMLASMRAESSWPEFMVGLDYGYMPIDRTSTYTAMLSFTLPWLSPRHADERREASANLSASQSALASARSQARYLLRDALVRYRAARDSFDLVERQLIPQAEMAAVAAQDAFRSGQSDSLGLLDARRQLLDMQLQQARSRARVQEAWAELERATGATPAAGSHS
jgi:cobalt-zinc-cadmium efflux system outer membrane protein